jgi:hypothetical protein
MKGVGPVPVSPPAALFKNELSKFRNVWRPSFSFLNPTPRNK